MMFRDKTRNKFFTAVIVIIALFQTSIFAQSSEGPKIEWDKPWFTMYENNINHSQRTFTNTGGTGDVEFAVNLDSNGSEWKITETVHLEAGQSYAMNIKTYYTTYTSSLPGGLIRTTTEAITVNSTCIEFKLNLSHMSSLLYYSPYISFDVVKLTGSNPPSDNSSIEPEQEPLPVSPDTKENTSVKAKKSNVIVLVNDVPIGFDAYNIGGSNYFKLRDIAMCLDGSNKSFEVTWDGATKAINLLSGKSYTPVGGELVVTNKTTEVEAKLTQSKVFLDGKEISLTAYNIGGSNYFKLRDIGEALNFGINWDGATSTVKIITSSDYVK